MITTKQVDQVFERWMECQRVYQCQDITSFIDTINQAYWDNLISACNQNHVLHNNIGNLLEADRTTKRINDAYFKLKNLLTIIEVDIDDFLNYLKAHHLFDETLPRPLSDNDATYLFEQYTLLMNTLFYHPNKVVQKEYLFTIANLFFEYAYVKDSYNTFFDMLHHESDYPFARFIQTMLWQFLSAEGWRNWHAGSLDYLKKESDAGKSIVYIAGGIDIYQLLRRGIYNIEVIDPLLPSQAADYYTESWLWLIDGSIGDEINISDDVVLRRHGHELFDTFQAVTAGGETVDIQHAHITWQVCHRHSSQIIGSVVFKRRFVQQSDFVINPTRTLLTSFNEMYLLGAPSYCEGWGIEVDPLVDDMIIVVKQLQKPVNAAIFKRLIRAINVPFRFINLGGCAT